MTTILDVAHSYQARGWAVYPLAPGTKVPVIKGGHGYKDATTDQAQAAEWWRQYPNANIGISLTGTGVLMFDIDRHEHGDTVADGRATLGRLLKEGRAGKLPPTYSETTPGDGLHLFYRYPEGMNLAGKSGTHLFGKDAQDETGLDFTTTGVPIAPSRRPEGQYKAQEGRTLDDIVLAPDWLLAELNRLTRPTVVPGAASSSPARVTWAGRLLNEMVNGTASGNRNDFLTRLGGKLFWSGADPETVYNMLLIENEHFLNDPLPVNELNAIYRSLRQREERKWLNAQS